MQNQRLDTSFFRRDVLEVAPELLGKNLFRRFPDGSLLQKKITEVEAYRGTDDLACHASRGITPRTEVMFRGGGVIYVYLIYGMYWMLNFVTGQPDEASAVLIRGIEGITGPGRVGRTLQLDKSFNGEDLSVSDRLWIGGNHPVAGYSKGPRIGIQYAGEPWISKPWRYYIP